jgi:hypothetical protein
MNENRHGGGRHRSLWKGPARITALILLLAALGNQFVEGWDWKPRGFVLVGALVFGVGVGYQLITWGVNSIAYRSAVAVALVSGFVLAWMNFVQAAGGRPGALTYLVVPVVGVMGAALARFHPRGMARALLATALVQASILSLAMVKNPPESTWAADAWRGLGLNASFVVLFVGSALLFRRSAREESARAAT